jgi:hypothetical protein
VTGFVPQPQPIRLMPPGRQRVTGRIIVGILALVVFGLALLFIVQALHARQIYRAAPACALGATGPDCRGTLDQLVVGVDIKPGKHPAPGVELPDGWVFLPDDAVSFAEGLTAGQPIAAEVWHGDVVSVTAGGQTFPTTDSPSASGAARVIFAALCFAVGFLTLRSASLSRMWQRLGYQASGGPELRITHWFNGVAFATAMIGLLFLALGLIAGIALAVLAVAAVLYALIVPTLVPLPILRR